VRGTSSSRKRIEPTARVDPSHLQRVVLMVLPDGTRVPWPETGVLGRHPHPAADLPEIAEPIRVPDPNRVTGRNHLLAGRDGHTLWVRDLGSANGTDLRLVSGEIVRLEAQARTVVSVGQSIWLAGEVELRVIQDFGDSWPLGE